jgi:RNA polymerase sigma-70 factor (ECF subfamily)
MASRERKCTRALRVVEPDDPALAFEPRSEILDRDEVERGFRGLDPGQRAVMVLHYYLGLPLTEAALVLGIPAGTAKSRLHRGLSAMRTALRARPALPDGRVEEQSA